MLLWPNFRHNAYGEWLEIWHAAVSWPPLKLVVIWSGLLIFLILAVFWICKTGKICSFRAFSRECIWGIDCNLPCWCTMTAFRTDSILVMVCWILSCLPWFCTNCIGLLQLRGGGGGGQLLDPWIYLFISNLAISEEMEKTNFNIKNYPATKRGVSLTTVNSL